MPGTFTNHKSLGYAFVNLVDVKTMKDWVPLKLEVSLFFFSFVVFVSEEGARFCQTSSKGFKVTVLPTGKAEPSREAAGVFVRQSSFKAWPF